MVSNSTHACFVSQLTRNYFPMVRNKLHPIDGTSAAFKASPQIISIVQGSILNHSAPAQLSSWVAELAVTVRELNNFMAISLLAPKRVETIWNKCINIYFSFRSVTLAALPPTESRSLWHTWHTELATKSGYGFSILLALSGGVCWFRVPLDAIRRVAFEMSVTYILCRETQSVRWGFS